MVHGSESSGGAPPNAGTRYVVLRCMFCGRKAMNKETYSPERVYPPGRSTFGIEHKCPKCGLVTRF